MRWFSIIAILALALSGGCFVLIAVSHVVYPGFTEPMEGDVLQHVERAAHGQTMYPVPGAEYIALAHMPLYYVLAAPFYLVLGDSLTGPRLLSVLCALISAFLVGKIATRETGSRATGVLAAAFFCAGYRAMDACLFCALPDSLYLMWLLLGYWFWAYGQSRRADLLWLLCFSLAFWTKQHGAFLFGWVVLFALLLRKNALPRGVILFGMALGGPIAYLVGSQFLGERFVYHTFTVPGKWDHSWLFSIRRTGFIIACVAPLALAAGLEWLRQSWRRGDRKPTPLGWFTAAALATAAFTMTAAGSSNNHYIVFLAMLAVVLAVQCRRLATTTEPIRLALPLAVLLLASISVTYVAAKSFANHDIPVFVPFVLAAVTLGFVVIPLVPASPARRAVAGVVLLVLGQFAICYYAPARYLPPAGWRDAADRLDGELARLDGPVVWMTYGRIPKDLLHYPLGCAPSWVALEDVERQVGNAERADHDLTPFRERFRPGSGIYLLTDEPLNAAQKPVWGKLADAVTLERNYGDAFEPLGQIAAHWYRPSGPPRYLYRLRNQDSQETRGPTQFCWTFHDGGLNIPGLMRTLARPLTLRTSP